MTTTPPGHPERQLDAVGAQPTLLEAPLLIPRARRPVARCPVCGNDQPTQHGTHDLEHLAWPACADAGWLVNSVAQPERAEPLPTPPPLGEALRLTDDEMNFIEEADPRKTPVMPDREIVLVSSPTPASGDSGGPGDRRGGSGRGGDGGDDGGDDGGEVVFGVGDGEPRPDSPVFEIDPIKLARERSRGRIAGWALVAYAAFLVAWVVLDVLGLSTDGVQGALVALGILTTAIGGFYFPVERD